jgi:hypothetical protein
VLLLAGLYRTRLRDYKWYVIHNDGIGDDVGTTGAWYVIHNDGIGDDVCRGVAVAPLDRGRTDQEAFADRSQPDRSIAATATPLRLSPIVADHRRARRDAAGRRGDSTPFVAAISSDTWARPIGLSGLV